MKRKITISHIIGAPTKGTIIINKHGMSVIDKSEFCSDSSVYRGFIRQLIDLDDWKHSWHMDVDNAQYKGSEERKKIRQIMLDKIAQREDEIQQLKDGIQVLGKWNIYS